MCVCVVCQCWATSSNIVGPFVLRMMDWSVQRTNLWENFTLWCQRFVTFICDRLLFLCVFSVIAFINNYICHCRNCRRITVLRSSCNFTTFCHQASSISCQAKVACIPSGFLALFFLSYLAHRDFSLSKPGPHRVRVARFVCAAVKKAMN